MEKFPQAIARMVHLALLVYRVDSCIHTFTNKNGQTGQFSSENYPRPYPAGLFCRYIFQGTLDERINITFQHFSLEPGIAAGCLNDYVDVFTVTLNNELTHEDRLCGERLPRAIISIHQRVELHFRTRNTANYTGFAATYTFIDELWQPFPPSDPRCGPEYIRGVGGIITSPGYPEPYPSNIECTWMIRVEDDMKIIMNFLVLDMGQSLTCKHTNIAIYDGFASPETPPSELLCGQLYFIKTKIKEFKGTTFRAVIRFVASEANELNSAGFRLTWTAVRLPDQFYNHEHKDYEQRCPEFHCHGGELCIDETKRLCNALQRYCIADELRCNGIPNCGAYDLSDEAGCAARSALIALAVIGPLFLIAVLMCCFITCRRRKKRLSEEKEKTAVVAEIRRNSLATNRSYHSGINNIYTSVPPTEVTLRQFDKSPCMRRYGDSTGGFTKTSTASTMPNSHGNSMALPSVQYGVNTDSYCSDTEQDYVSSCSNYGSPASLRYHTKPIVSYRVVQPSEHTTNHHSISATV